MLPNTKYQQNTFLRQLTSFSKGSFNTKSPHTNSPIYCFYVHSTFILDSFQKFAFTRVQSILTQGGLIIPSVQFLPIFCCRIYTTQELKGLICHTFIHQMTGLHGRGTKSIGPKSIWKISGKKKNLKTHL